MTTLRTEPTLAWPEVRDAYFIIILNNLDLNHYSKVNIEF